MTIGLLTVAIGLAGLTIGLALSLVPSRRLPAAQGPVIDLTRGTDGVWR